ncbi:MAG: protein-L-isoaspartate(D-aspartate) O-methyltransferase [Flavobacteriales bacterium]|nr:protein-L-isoaspartate(D-aspartate) O-methyltransferase [Flavobacteriales bacterium]
MQDTLKHKGMRKKLIEVLRVKGIDNQMVLDVINEIPRHLFFFDTAFLHLAYEDKAFPIGSGQTISQPFTVAFQTSLLNPKKREKVLEIGTGSGYQTAVLSKLGMKVFTIERQHALHLKSRDLLEEMRIPARCFYGDGYAGKTAFAPFDKILVTCGAPKIPDALKEQLKVGGRMVIPVGEVNGVQHMLTIDKVSETEYVTEEHGDFQFVPMLERTDNAD